MNTAQTLLASWVGLVDHPEASLSIAAQQTRAVLGKAPTPAKPRYPRHTRNRMVFMKSRDEHVVMRPRPFKGHRP